ncbi:MAG: flagellin [Hungatella hathewayi]|nr:flagellin [Hungatella hathewayi]
MRIQHNIMALNSHRQLGLANDAIGKSLEKLSSGFRINRAGDDAAGLAISEKMRAKIKGLESAMSNSQDAISLVQTAEGAMQEIHSMLNRMAELATKASNSTYDATDRQAIQDELDAMSDEIDRIADSIEFNGTKLMDGSATELKLRIGDTNDSFNELKLKLTDMHAEEIGIPAADLKVNDVDAADGALAAIKTAINNVSKARSYFGANQNRLDHTMNNLGTTTENLTAAESRIRDVDMASEMINYTKNSVLVQSAQAMLAQANLQPQSILQLLQ